MQLALSGILRRIERKLGTDKQYVNKLLPLFKNKTGIEIGGPTDFFSDTLPVYSVIDSVDGCNFTGNTIWEGSIEAGSTYDFGGKKNGYQYISEASNLKEIPSGKYDFLLASHCLEHCANTLKTVNEWLRVVKPGGIILLILPDKRYTFDHKRKVTLYTHLKDDFNNDVDEKDLTHLEEILSLHDLSRDSGAIDKQYFRKRSLNNFQNRCLHHHVFDFRLLVKIFLDLKVEIQFKKFVPPYHQIIVGKKSFHKS